MVDDESVDDQIVIKEEFQEHRSIASDDLLKICTGQNEENKELTLTGIKSAEEELKAIDMYESIKKKV